MHTEEDYKQRLEEIQAESVEASTFLENDDVAQFIEMHGVGRGYECAILKQVQAPQSSRMMLAHQITFEDKIPGAEAIVGPYGDGEYEWRIVSKNRTLYDELKEKKVIRVSKVFIGPHWKRIHQNFIREQDRQDRQERRRIQREEMEELALEGIYGFQRPSGGSSPEMIELIKAMKPDATESPMMLLLMKNMFESKPGFNWQAFAATIAAVSPALAPILSRIFAAPAPPPKGPFDEIVTRLVESTINKKVEDMEPPEASRHWVLEIIDSLSSALPLILTTLKTIPPIARGATANAAVKAYPRGKELLQALKTDPEALSQAVEKLDQDHGTSNTDAILSSLGFERPEASKSNYSKYPTGAAEEEQEARQ